MQSDFTGTTIAGTRHYSTGPIDGTTTVPPDRMSPVFAASAGVRPKPRLALEIMMLLKVTSPSKSPATVGHCSINSCGSTVALWTSRRVASRRVRRPSPQAAKGTGQDRNTGTGRSRSQTGQEPDKTCVRQDRTGTRHGIRYQQHTAGTRQDRNQTGTRQQPDSNQTGQEPHKARQESNRAGPGGGGGVYSIGETYSMSCMAVVVRP